jgi:hypothetical protein
MLADVRHGLFDIVPTEHWTALAATKRTCHSIATGSAPFFIPVVGKDLPGVLAFRDLDDVNAMVAATCSASRRQRR